jgi:TPR repeat protein
MFDGLYGEAVDYWKAKEWLEPAAEDWNIFAMRLLSRFWEIGFPELHMPPDHEKAKEY